MNRKHLFRAVFFADLRKSFGYGFSGATPIAFALSQARRRFQQHFRSDWDSVTSKGGYNASA